MKLHKILTTSGMARSRSEAETLIKQGAVSAGGCDPDCSFFNTGKCTCGGWAKFTDPVAEVPPGWAVKVGAGFHRTIKKIKAYGVDILPGVTKTPRQAASA